MGKSLKDKIKDSEHSKTLISTRGATVVLQNGVSKKMTHSDFFEGMNRKRKKGSKQ